MMKLPILDPKFTHLAPPVSGEVFHSFSKGLCPACKRPGDADWFLKSLTYIKEGSIPLKYSTAVEKGCPDDCGLCPDHEQHSCLPIIEITNHCNLECPICIVQNRHNYDMTKEEFARILDGLVEKEGVLETIN